MPLFRDATRRPFCQCAACLSRFGEQGENREVGETSMRHIKVVSSEMPASAIWVEDHPGVRSSVKGFLRNPVGVLELHVDYLFKENNNEVD